MDFLKKFSKENTKKDEEFEITLHDKITAHQTERRRLTGRITADFRPHDYVLTIKTANRYPILANFMCENPFKTYFRLFADSNLKTLYMVAYDCTGKRSELITIKNKTGKMFNKGAEFNINLGDIFHVCYIQYVPICHFGDLGQSDAGDFMMAIISNFRAYHQKMYN